MVFHLSSSNGVVHPFTTMLGLKLTKETGDVILLLTSSREATLASKKGQPSAKAGEKHTKKQNKQTNKRKKKKKKKRKKEKKSSKPVCGGVLKSTPFGISLSFKFLTDSALATSLYSPNVQKITKNYKKQKQKKKKKKIIRTNLVSMLKTNLLLGLLGRKPQ